MYNIDRYKSQHKLIILLSKQLLSFSTISEIKKDAALILKIFSTLSNILEIHLQSEDENFYPKLLKHKNHKIRKQSIDLQDKITETTKLYRTYKGKYLTEAMIQADPQTYINDTQQLINTLLTRVEKEETELYSLL